MTAEKRNNVLTIHALSKLNVLSTQHRRWMSVWQIGLKTKRPATLEHLDIMRDNRKTDREMNNHFAKGLAF